MVPRVAHRAGPSLRMHQLSRSLRGRPEEAWREREDVRRLLQRTDGDTLDPFVLRRDKRHVFSSDGHAVLGYRAVLGVGLASGDPVGESISFGSAIASYVDRCDRNGWRIGSARGARDNLRVRELGIGRSHRRRGGDRRGRSPSKDEGCAGSPVGGQPTKGVTTRSIARENRWEIVSRY